MPVYWFALSQVPVINNRNAILIFGILHLLVYPASNGYNSYMDRDTESIGGIEHPLQPTRELLRVTMLMDIISILAGLLISVYFVIGITAYILASRAYSFRGIRLKKYPFIGYLTVIIFQGAVSFAIVYHGASADLTLRIPVMLMLVSSLLIGGFYPLTQIYQHKADLKDGVASISYKLGYRGTFIFCALVYGLAFGLLLYYFTASQRMKDFLILATCMLPILVYFFMWASGVWKNTAAASFRNTMRMNLIASLCTNIGFVTLLIRRHFE